MNHHLPRLAMVLLVCAIVAIGGRDQAMSQPPSNVKTDEYVLLFPTYGHYDREADVWRFPVHGKVFEPEYSSAKRAALIAALRTSAVVGAGLDDSAFIDARIRPFLVDNERGKSITIEIAGQHFAAGTSKSNGHFTKTLVLNANSNERSEVRTRIQETRAVLRGDDSRTFTGRVHLIAPHGVSVISDVDDTIKHSQVTNKSQLLLNTFVRDFTAVEGMPELYAALANSEVAFHYVSGSPWQLYQPLEAFMSQASFPQGTFHLKQFRLKDSSARDLLSSQHGTKLAAITPLLTTFPERTFILIGDSGEQDPEIYGEIARQYLDQIVGIYIRNVTNETSGNQRFAKAFVDIPKDRWMLFDDVSQISPQILAHAKTRE